MMALKYNLKFKMAEARKYEENIIIKNTCCINKF